jgi:putative N6-adenine-specific DNA methylase
MRSFCIDVPFAKHRDFNNTHFVAQLAKDALCDRLKKEKGSRPSVDTKNPEVRFSTILMPNKAVFYFDTSGEALFRRGYRTDSAEAPIKENLAAALLMLAGFKKEDSLVDPCCGTGTFLIEAALMATNTPPGFFRKRFGFFAHPVFQMSSWEKMREDAAAKITDPVAPIYGIEKDTRTYMHLRKSIAQASFNKVITTFEGDFKQILLPTSLSFLISNPPFGVRLGRAHQHEELYKDLGSFIKTSLSRPATAAVLSHSIHLLQKIGIQPIKTIPLSHGGLDCFFSVFKIL